VLAICDVVWAIPEGRCAALLEAVHPIISALYSVVGQDLACTDATERCARNVMTSEFDRWSQWLRCSRGFGEQPENKLHAVALMAWIASHAKSDGATVQFDQNSWSSLIGDVGLTADEGRNALDTLIAHGLVTAVGQETADQLEVRAVL